MHIGTRLKAEMKAAQITPTDMARHVGVSVGAVSNWFKTGRITKENLVKASERIGKPIEELITGSHEVRESAAAYNVTPIAVGRRVPLISEVQAGSWADISDPFQPGEADEWVTAYQARLSKHAFALEVTGDSMTAQAGISFPAGTVIFVDPDRASSAGDFVVAKDVATQRATFKKLVTDGGRWFLKPLNPAYPMLEIDDPALRVIGRVMEYQNSGKL